MKAPLHPIVLRGLKPRIHLPRKTFFKRWIVGSRPAVTMCILDRAA